MLDASRSRGNEMQKETAISNACLRVHRCSGLQEQTHDLDVAFGGRDMQSCGARFRMCNITKRLGVHPASGVFEHESLFGVPGLFAVDALGVDLFLQEVLHFVGFRYVDGQFAIVVHGRHVSAVFQKVPEVTRRASELISTRALYQQKLTLLC